MLFPVFCFSQEGNIKALDINLTNYEYPFPIKSLELNSQRQSLKMAYMDVIPENYNKKNIVLLHGKTLMALIGNQLLKP